MYILRLKQFITFRNKLYSLEKFQVLIGYIILYNHISIYLPHFKDTFAGIHMWSSLYQQAFQHSSLLFLYANNADTNHFSYLIYRYVAFIKFLLKCHRKANWYQHIVHFFISVHLKLFLYTTTEKPSLNLMILT